MAKPASGTALDTGHALYTSLLSVHAFLEGSGTTADSKGTATGTLANSGTWTTDGDGALVSNTDAGNDALTLSSVVQPGIGTNDWSIAFRGKQTTSNDNGMVAADQNAAAGSQVWFRGGTGLKIRGDNGFGVTFTGVTSFTTQADYVVTYTQSAGTLRLYVNGTITSDGAVAWGSTSETFAFGEFMSDYAAGHVGTLSYFYAWKGRILTGAEATTLASTPYVIFTGGGGGGGGTILPAPTLTLMGVQ